jgi:hypothetical protein
MHNAKKSILLAPFTTIAASDVAYIYLFILEDSMRRVVLAVVSMLVLLATITGTYVMRTRSAPANATGFDWQSQRRGPRDALRVYWVGHSLMEAQVDTAEGKFRLLEMVGYMAQAQGLPYAMGDHTLWGAPLSLQWRGRPHSYARHVPERAERRQRFAAQAAQYDVIVLTESIPISDAMQYEHSAYYLQQFYCTLMEANPEGRVYLYESWPPLQALEPDGKYRSPQRYAWRDRTLQDRRLWERLADEARSAPISPPGWLPHLPTVLWSSAPICRSHAPIFLVPVATAMVELYDRLRAPRPEDDFSLPDGRRLGFTDLFRNPYIDWPAHWPVKGQQASAVDEMAIIAALTLRDPAAVPDDIHPSQVGVYFAALVNFATLYRRSPVGLPAFNEIGAALAGTLQAIAWEIVRNDARTGVQP